MGVATSLCVGLRWCDGMSHTCISSGDHPQVANSNENMETTTFASVTARRTNLWDPQYVLTCASVPQVLLSSSPTSLRNKVLHVEVTPLTRRDTPREKHSAK